MTPHKPLRVPMLKTEKLTLEYARLVHAEYMAGQEGLEKIALRHEIGWVAVRTAFARFGLKVKPKGWQKGSPNPRKKVVAPC